MARGSRLGWKLRLAPEHKLPAFGQNDWRLPFGKETLAHLPSFDYTTRSECWAAPVREGHDSAGCGVSLLKRRTGWHSPFGEALAAVLKCPAALVESGLAGGEPIPDRAPSGSRVPGEAARDWAFQAAVSPPGKKSGGQVPQPDPSGQRAGPDWLEGHPAQPKWG